MGANVQTWAGETQEARLSLPAALEILIEDLRKWRETELAAEQDVEDAERKANKTRAALRHVQAEVKAATDAIDRALNDYTTPLQIIFISEGDD